MFSLIQEHRVDELMVWDANLTALLARPSDKVLKRHVTRASVWVGLLYELNLLQSAFTRMLLRDQTTAVELFEVENVKTFPRNEKMEIVPTEVEMIRASFIAPFLASAFDIAWAHIKAANVEPVALYELKRVTVHRIPGRWIREDRNGDSTFAVTNLLKGRQDQCDICGDYAGVPFARCWYCGEGPCYHHGRCCPSRRDQPASSSTRRPIA